MSERFPGGFVTMTPPTPSGGTTGAGSASGVWTLDQATSNIQAGQWPLVGNYIEDVFSAYLWDGDNNTNRAIQNGIDLAGRGGMVWIKNRSGTEFNNLWDTARGANNYINSNSTGAQGSITDGVKAFSGTGFTVGNNAYTNLGGMGYKYSSWTFRKQEKFFDIVTWTGDGTSPRTISHSLGSTPGCIIIKCTSISTNPGWCVWHRSRLLEGGFLNSTAAFGGAGAYFGSTVTSTTFSLNSANIAVNGSTQTYVAYLFAHDAGGFGATGNDNVISCGSFTTDGSGIASVNLGYEPQWVLFKASSDTTNWYILDNMRGLDAVYDQGGALFPNLSNAETTFDPLQINATGFNVKSASNPSTTYIYIAIRRGPMKTPTRGTSVFTPVARSGNSSTATITAGFPVDLAIVDGRTKAANTTYANFEDRLRGANLFLQSGTYAAEATAAATVSFDNSTGINMGADTGIWGFNRADETYINWMFQRAPGFMDVVSYTGNGAIRTISHNLGVAPELIIVKRRDSTSVWSVYAAPVGATKVTYFDAAAPINGPNHWNSTAPTSSVFSLGIAS